MHLRVKGDPHPKDYPEFDLFVTVLRHKYIPPLMEYFTDLMVLSRKRVDYKQLCTQHAVKLADSTPDDLR